MVSGEGYFLNVLGRFDYWNHWAHVGTNPGRAEVSVGRLPEGVLVVVGSSR